MMQTAIQEQYDLLMSRKNGGEEKSYTCYLYRSGRNKILKKCGEECFEAVVAAKSEDKAETVGEINDVIYHVTVLLCLDNIPLADVMTALNIRCGTTGLGVDALSSIIEERSHEEVTEDGSHYTAYLFHKGLDKVLKKVGEACALLLIAAKDGDNAVVAEQTADLLYHLLVMMQMKGITPADVAEELNRRSQKTGNLKVFHTSNHNS